MRERITQVLVGGTILTSANPARVEAVAVAGDRIAAVGTREEILALRTAGTETTDLRGAALLPGLIEPHTHPDLCAQCYAWVDVSGFMHASVRGVEQALRAALAKTPRGEWVFAFGLDPMLTPDLGAWGRDRLDALAPEHPVMVLIQSMHTAFVNTRALVVAGIGDATPNPPGGGVYQHDAAGRLTGKIEEAPAINAFARFFDQSEAALRARLAEQYQRYRAVGLTAIGVAGLFLPPRELGVFTGVARDGGAPLRTIAYLRADQVGKLAYRPGDGDARFRVQGVKLWYDGSPYTGTMLVDEPYLDSELCCCTLGIPRGTVGHANFEPGDLVDLLSQLHRDGWQVLTHAQGDRGTREILDLYEKVLGPHAGADHRWRLEHCMLASEVDLRRALRLGVTPSFHVNHVRYYGPELRDSILGPARAARMMPLGSAAAMGHRVSLHADSPMYPPGPLSLVRTAVTRLTRTGEPLARDQALTLEQALRAVTLDAAWQLFADGEIGSIEPGKRADFSVLERDPFEVDPADLDRIAVLDTWLAGAPTTPRA